MDTDTYTAARDLSSAIHNLRTSNDPVDTTRISQNVVAYHDIFQSSPIVEELNRRFPGVVRKVLARVSDAEKYNEVTLS